MKYYFLFLLFLIFCIVQEPTYADTNKLSVSGSLGLGSAETPACNIFNANCINGEPCNIQQDVGGVSGTVALGYSLNKYLRIDSGFVFYPTSNYKLDNTLQSGSVSLTFNSIFLLTQTFLPLGKTVSIYALCGVALTHRTTEAEYKNITTKIKVLPGHQSNNSFSPALGYGISFQIAQDVDLYCNSLYVMSRGDITTDSKSLPELGNMTIGITVYL